MVKWRGGLGYGFFWVTSFLFTGEVCPKEAVSYYVSTQRFQARSVGVWKYVLFGCVQAESMDEQLTASPLGRMVNGYMPPTLKES